jgi:hypothetical protein
MAPAREHFVIYKPINTGIIIATVLHSRRDIDKIIRNMAVTLSNAILDMEGKT